MHNFFDHIGIKSNEIQLLQGIPTLAVGGGGLSEIL